MSRKQRFKPTLKFPNTFFKEIRATHTGPDSEQVELTLWFQASKEQARMLRQLFVQSNPRATMTSRIDESRGGSILTLEADCVERDA